MCNFKLKKGLHVISKCIYVYINTSFVPPPHVQNRSVAPEPQAEYIRQRAPLSRDRGRKVLDKIC